MQFLSPIRPPDYAGEAAAGAHLPYSHMVDDATLALRDGSLAQVIRIDGLMFETADGDTLNYRKDMRKAMLRAIGSSRFALYHHILRRRVEPELEGAFPDDFSAGLDAAWRERLAARQLGAYETAHGDCSEPLEFLGALFNSDMAPMLLPHGDVGHHLPRARVSFGHDTLQMGDDFAAMVSIKDYPSPPDAADRAYIMDRLAHDRVLFERLTGIGGARAV